MAFLRDQSDVMSDFIDSTKPLREAKYAHEIQKEGTYAQRALDAMEKARLETSAQKDIAQMNKDAYVKHAEITSGLGQAAPGSFLEKFQTQMLQGVTRKNEMGNLEFGLQKKAMADDEAKKVKAAKEARTAKIKASFIPAEGPSFLSSYLNSANDLASGLLGSDEAGMRFFRGLHQGLKELNPDQYFKQIPFGGKLLELFGG